MKYMVSLLKSYHLNYEGTTGTSAQTIATQYTCLSSLSQFIVYCKPTLL